MNTKILFFTIVMLLISTVIGWIFWEQEVKYALPTPIPSNFVDKEIGQKVDLSDYIPVRSDRSVLLHFYSDQCPCSRFNMKEFERLARKFKEEIDFYVVVQSKEDNAVEEFQDKYDLDIPTILDKDGMISDLCGIYSTPQAVLINTNSEIYFKGNYNKARFCTRKETRYVAMALERFINKEPLPLDLLFSQPRAYGCTLPSDEHFHLENEAGLLGVFN